MKVEKINEYWVKNTIGLLADYYQSAGITDPVHYVVVYKDKDNKYEASCCRQVLYALDYFKQSNISEYIIIKVNKNWWHQSLTPEMNEKFMWHDCYIEPMPK